MKRLASSLLLGLSLLGCQAEGAKPTKVAPAPVGEPAKPPLPKTPTTDVPVRQPSTDINDEHYQMPALPMARVILVDAFKGKHPVDVEVAAYQDARTRGLMWRTELADGKGMLFIFPQQTQLSFWMRNTLIPLDMLFIDANKKVVGIVENAEPKTLTSRGTGQPAQYVLEVPGGWCAKQGIKAGSVVTLEGTKDIPVTP